MLSRGVIVFDYEASVFCIVCKNFSRRMFSQRVVVFDYQASVFCICKIFLKTYAVWMSRIITIRVCRLSTFKMTVVLESMRRSLT